MAEEKKEFTQEDQNAWQSKESAKARAQSFIAGNQNKGSSFVAGKDYTGGASSIGAGMFNPRGQRGIGSVINNKYNFKP